MYHYFNTLGLLVGAGFEEVKLAYRTLVKKYHPDLNNSNPNSEKKFLEIGMAYEALKKHFNHLENEKLVSPPSPKEYNLSYTIKITFLEAALGVQKKIILHPLKSIIDDALLSILIDIPAGIHNNETLNVDRTYPCQNKGDNKRHSEFIHIILSVCIKIAVHLFFKRNNWDIHLNFPLTLSETLKGGEFIVPTIYGNSRQTFLAPCLPEREICLAGYGILNPKTGLKGNQYIKFNLNLSPFIDNSLKNYIQEWEQKHPYDPRQSLKI